MSVNFSDLYLEQLNDPDCSVLSGIVTGQMLTLVQVSKVIVLYVCFKLLDGFVITPIVRGVKFWWRNRK